MNSDNSGNQNSHYQWRGKGHSPVAVVLAVACLVALLLSVDSTLLAWIGIRVYVLVIAVVPGLLLALGCTGWGDTMVRWTVRQEQDLFLPERVLFAFACGMGIVSCATLVLGMTGLMNQLNAMWLLAAGLAVGLPLWKLIATEWPGPGLGTDNTRSCHYNTALSKSSKTGSVVVGALLSIALLLIAAVSLTPPIIFDVTEYHLGAWTNYAQQTSARFIPMPHNFYARFPFPIESLYFLGLTLAPYHDAAPKVLNALCVIACAAVAGLLAWRLGAGRNGIFIAALVALAHPVMLDVSIDAMIDAPVALLVAGSVYTGFLATGRFGEMWPKNARMLFPATFLFGSALAAKYTVAQVYLLPWLVLVLWPMLRGHWRRPLFLAAAGMIALVPCVLWLGKNVYFYGNPLEPFFVRWFRPDDAAGIARERFYIESHFPQSPLTLAYWSSLLQRLREFQWVLLVACAGWIFHGRNSAAIRLLLFATGAWLLWNLVRESQNRFLLPAMVLLAPVAVCGAMAFPTAVLRRVVLTVLILFAAIQLTRYTLTLHKSGTMDYILEFGPTNRQTLPGQEDETAREKFYGENLGDLGRIINELNRSLPADANVLMIYEARPYLLRHSSLYNVVWDESVLLNLVRPAATSAEALQLLRDADITHVLVNRQELLRYIQQYARPSQLRRLGLRSGEDPRAAWSATATPENLYPPFYNDADWQRLRPIVQDLLRKLDSLSIIRHGAPAPGPGLQALDVTLTPIL